MVLRLMPKPTPKTVMAYKTTSKLRPRTPTPPLTAMKPMAIWITTVNPMVLRQIPKPTPKTVTIPMITMRKTLVS